MRPFLRKGVLLVALCCWLASSAMAQEQTAYENWAQFKPESFVTYLISTETAGVQTETQMTYKLVDVTPEHVMLEMTTVTETMGVTVETPGESFEIPKDGGTMPTPMSEDVVDIDVSDAMENSSRVEEKQETVEVNGQKVEALIIRVETESAGEATTVTFWSSEKFPGQIIKSVTEVGGYVPVKVEMVAIDFQAIL